MGSHNSTISSFISRKSSETNSKLDEFTAYFFKKLPKLINLNSSIRNKIFAKISEVALSLFEDYGETIFWSAFNALYIDQPAAYLENKEILIPLGVLSDDRKAFLAFQGTSVSKEQLNSEISAKLTQNRRIKYSLLLYICSGRISESRYKKATQDIRWIRG